MRTLSLLMVLLSVSVEARGEEPQTILESVDDAINRAKDQFLAYDMIDEKSGSTRTLRLEVSIKGDKRLTAFTAPADLAGTKVLILSSTQMYIYLPSYKKVRRIASHVTAQGFMGTTYSNDDLSLLRYADKYTAKLASESAEEVRLTLSKKAETAPYPKIEMTLERKRRLPMELRYFGEDGKLRKTEKRTDYTCEGDVCAPAQISMRDHTDGDHVSKLVRKKWKVNSGIADRLFTKRSLARAR